jgi:hypothetical protein
VDVPKKQVEAETSFKEFKSQYIVQARLVKTANQEPLAAHSTLIRTINGTKFKSLTSSKRQAALVAESRAAVVLTDCIVSKKKSAQNNSAITNVLIHAKRVAFAAKKIMTEASMAKDDDVLNNLLDDHQ